MQIYFRCRAASLSLSAAALLWAPAVGAQAEAVLSAAEEGRADESDRYADEPALEPIEPFVAPTGPIELRYRVTRPLRYSVGSRHRVAVRDRPDLEQVYTSSQVARYEPAGERVRVEIERTFGAFEVPAGLKQTERTHQLLRGARFSYRLGATGEVSEIAIEEGTFALARPSLKVFAALAAGAAAPLPERAVKPGDSWTQTVRYRDGSGPGRASEDAINTYTLESWRPCRAGGRCASIKIEQTLKASARLGAGRALTRGATTGGGSGFLLFDIDRGEVVKSVWTIKAQGRVAALPSEREGAEPLAEAEVLVQAEMTSERIDDGPLPQVPTR